MNVGKQVRLLYEKRPYPRPGRPAARRPPWLLPPIEWINAVWQPTRNSPERILVAGCGTGTEAFALRRRFPRSEIVGADFCTRSIEVARRGQRQAISFRSIQFLVADLANRRSMEIAGSNFDFISCHGVLSYIPKPERALRNLARSLAPSGALYLGVNGDTHFSARWRRFLPAFGFEMNELPHARQLVKHLELCETLAGERVGRISKKDSSYLAGDLFGPLIQNLSLTEWSRMGLEAGLHLCAGYAASHLLRPALNNGLYELLIPRSRAEVAEILDVICPNSFHALLFLRRAEPAVPWDKPDELLAWRPVPAMHLRRHPWPRRRGAWKALRDLKIQSRATNTLIELRVPEWEIEILRKSDGQLPLGGILASVTPAVRAASLRQQLYVLYQLNVLNFLPPAPG
jgi:SAM-dependent methyltransferase